MLERILYSFAKICIYNILIKKNKAKSILKRKYRSSQKSPSVRFYDLRVENLSIKLGSNLELKEKENNSKTHGPSSTKPPFLVQ